MPIENQRLTPIGADIDTRNFGDDRGPDFRGLENLGTAIGTIRTERRVGEYTAALEGEEQAFQLDVVRLSEDIQKNEPAFEAGTTYRFDAVTGEQSFNPVVRDMLMKVRKEQRAAAQGKIDTSVLEVNKERIFREFAARYPKLVPQFLQATQAGLAGGLVSKETQSLVDAYNGNAEAQAAEYKQMIAESGAKHNSYRYQFENTPQGEVDFYQDVVNVTNAAKAEADAKRLLEVQAANGKNAEVYITGHYLKHANSKMREFSGSLKGYLMQQLNLTDPREIGNAVQNMDLDQIKETMLMAANTWINKEMENPAFANTSAQFREDLFKQYREVATRYGEMMGTAKGMEAFDRWIKTTEGSALIEFGVAEATTIEIIGKGGGLAGLSLNNDIFAKSIERMEGYIGSRALPSALVNPDGSPNFGTGRSSEQALDTVGGLSDVDKNKINSAYVKENIQSLNLNTDQRQVQKATANLSALAIQRGSEILKMEQVALSGGNPIKYLPDDTNMRLLVSGLAHPTFKDTFDQYSVNDQNHVRYYSQKVLQQELAYIASGADATLGKTVTVPMIPDTRPGAGTKPAGTLYDVAASGMGIGVPTATTPKATIEEFMELGVMADGRVVLDFRPGMSDIPEPMYRQLQNAQNQFLRTYSPRLTTTVKAMLNLGLITDAEQAISVMAGTNGFPIQLLPKPPKSAESTGGGE